AEIRALVIVVADDHLVARKHLAADQHLVMRQLGEVAFREALLEFLETLERGDGLALILVLAPDLIVVAHPDVVGDELEVLAGRMHPLEIVERANRLGVILLLVIGEADFHLGIFGVGAERILVDHLLIVLDRGLVLFVREIELALRVVVLAGGLLAQTAGGRRQQYKSHQYYQQAFHFVTQKRLDKPVRHCNPSAIFGFGGIRRKPRHAGGFSYFWIHAACGTRPKTPACPPRRTCAQTRSARRRARPRRHG